MVKETYIKKDLIDYIEAEDVASAIRRPSDRDWQDYDMPHSRADAVRRALPDSATVNVESVGSYQGREVLCIECDGYIWLRHSYYGSCSVCDAFLADEVAETESILRGAYCFENADDAIAYLESTEDFAWTDLRSKAIQMVRNL